MITQEEIEYTLGRIKILKDRGLSETVRHERAVLALLLIADDLHAIRGMLHSLLLAMGEKYGN